MWRRSNLICVSLVGLAAAGCAPEGGMSARMSADPAGVAAAENPMVGGAPMYASRDIVENAVNSADHTTLVAAVQAADLAAALKREGPFTVFAPTDAAFDALPEGAVASLMEPANRDELRRVLAYHVVPANALSSDIGRMIAMDGGAHPVQTLSGDRLVLRMDPSGDITVTDEQGRTATVTIADVRQSNGVIHVVDRVLLPQ